MTSWDDLLQAVSRRAGDKRGAGEAGVRLLEERLGVRLPPDYREFLTVTGGWNPDTPMCPPLRPPAQVGWTRDVDPDLAEGWGDDLPPVPDEEYFLYGPEQDCALHFRSEYLRDTLHVSDWDDGQVVLLNPRIVSPGGEWEAWDYANWHPGAVRYRSFRELLEVVYADGLAQPN
ncbi:SMI1/KNR4 family protein [Herbidospora cretacea]|uniref:SMI1/KNR4 family protein n=1 Tax=Herbidospora cretacea TaxID=28444 RepID=UPI000AD6E292|nr:SMI1/KNR4 family protein [Herbidospora cretacea]